MAEVSLWWQWTRVCLYWRTGYGWLRLQLSLKQKL